MKYAIRLAALTFVIAAACTHASPSKASETTAKSSGFYPPGQPPMCNPFTEVCPTIR